MITTEELARIRAIAESDKAGADGKAWDEANYLAEGYTTAVELFHECPLGNNLCRKVSCMECMREFARSTLERYK